MEQEVGGFQENFLQEIKKETHRNLDVFDCSRGGIIAVREFRNKLRKVTKIIPPS